MALIKSISGIRGTIGGKAGEALTPLDIVRFTAAYGTWLSKKAKNRKIDRSNVSPDYFPSSLK